MSAIKPSTSLIIAVATQAIGVSVALGVFVVDVGLP